MLYEPIETYQIEVLTMFQNLTGYDQNQWEQRIIDMRANVAEYLMDEVIVPRSFTIPSDQDRYKHSIKKLFRIFIENGWFSMVQLDRYHRHITAEKRS